MFFEYPYLLWLLAIPVLLVALYLYRELSGRNPHMRVSTARPWKLEGRSALSVLRHLPFALRIAALSMIIVAIARPRSSSQMEKIDTEGIDIVLAMDVSTSMLARDFNPDRISAAKDIAIEFIAQRPTDRIGIVVFAGESYTQCPLTTDRATLINLMKEVQTDLIEDGTAIDGVNNSGEIAPLTAAEIANTYGVRVYTIGVGANGTAPYPVMTPWGVDIQRVNVEIDEDLLKTIAETTGGRYFRATDNTKLAEIYSEINRMEKARTTIDSFPIYKELFTRYALLALAFLLLELLIRLFIRRLP